MKIYINNIIWQSFLRDEVHPVPERGDEGDVRVPVEAGQHGLDRIDVKKHFRKKFSFVKFHSFSLTKTFTKS